VSSANDPGVPDAPAAPPRRSDVREFAFTLILSLVVLSATRKDVGFLLPLLAPFLLLWFVRLAWIAWRQPARRRTQAIKLACVVAATALATWVQASVERQARAQAQKTVDAVAAYRAQHGNYPDELGQVGLDEEALRRQWRVRYTSRDGQHRVSYPASFSVYDGYVYDLDKPGWAASAD
jgi:hypothetical protein